MKILRTSIVLIGLSLASSAAFADEVIPSEDEVFTKWGDAAGWSIYIDKTRNSCLMQKSNGTDAIVQIGLSENDKFAYLGVFGKVAPEVRARHSSGDTVLMIDDMQFKGKLRGWNSENADYHGAYVQTKDLGIAEDVIQRAEVAREVIVFPDEQLSFSVSMSGSAEALEAAKKCFAEQRS